MTGIRSTACLTTTNVDPHTAVTATREIVAIRCCRAVCTARL